MSNEKNVPLYKKLLYWLHHKNPPPTTSKIYREFEDYDQSHVLRTLQKMKMRGCVKRQKARKGIEIPKDHLGRPPHVWAITETGQRAAESFYPSLKDASEYEKARARHFIPDGEAERLERAGKEYAKFLKNL